MATSAITRPAPRVRLWAAAAAAAIVVVHLPSLFHRLLDSDEAIYASIAALVNGGAQLYAEGGVDNKPPGIFWVYAATFHFAGDYQMAAVHVVELCVLLATCALLFIAGRALAGPRAGILAALFYGLVTAAGNPTLLAANTELFMMLPLTATVLLMLRRQWFWAGMLLVAAGAFKQVAAVNVLMVPVAIVLLASPGRRLRASGTFAVGLLTGLLFGGLLLVTTGSVAGFWHWTVGILYGFAQANWTPDSLWFRARYSLLPLLESTALLWVAAILYASRWRQLHASERVIVSWLLVSTLGSLAGGHFFLHYFIEVMAPLALLAGLAIDSMLNGSKKRWVAAATALALAVPTVIWGAYDLAADPLTYDLSPPIPQHQLVAAYVRDHTKPGDRIFVWGDWAPLYVESDRSMASRFPGFLRGFARGSNLPPNNWDTAPDVWPELQADLTRNPPALIVDTAAPDWSGFAMYPMRNYPVVENLVATQYHLVAVVDGVGIYARNS